LLQLWSNCANVAGDRVGTCVLTMPLMQNRKSSRTEETETAAPRHGAPDYEVFLRH
jgi:hypothetical protein